MTVDRERNVLEVVREFANIGAGNAATALASILETEMMNEVPSCEILPLTDVSDWLGGGDKVVAGVYTHLCGELKSGLLLVFPGESAKELLNRMTKEKVDLASLDELQLSALREAGNICLCWYLMAVSKMIDMDMIPAAPDATVDLLGAVMDMPLASLGIKADKVLAVRTVFNALDAKFEGFFLMLPEQNTLNLMMDRIKAKC
jgi:chemotaxis protein CheC